MTVDMVPMGSSLGPYHIRSLLGEGGMGKVYRAWDPRLRREVAIKVVAREGAARLRRLRREARAAAALNHPNIVSVFDIGECADGREFIVTELVEGMTLASLLRTRRLTVRETLDLAVSIAEALAAAHRAGIVHRDLKPSNILITTTGAPKIADFGLAKFTDVPGDDSLTTLDGEDRTAEGLVAGTVPYMSPEQARGEPVDFHSDQFSFGALLFEMLVQRRLFEASSPEAALKLVGDSDASRAEISEAPVDLQRIVQRLVARDPGHRYGSTDDLVEDLRALRAGAQPSSTKRLIIAALAVIVAMATVIFFVSRRRPAETPPPPRPTRETIIAVLPFRNVGGEQSLEHFGLGLADALIGRLATLPNVTVRPTSTIMPYEGSDAIRAGRELGVSKVLEGAFERVDGRLRITTQLTDVPRRATVWSTTLVMPRGELFRIQDSAAEAVASALRVGIAPSARRVWSREVKVGDAAMEHYLALRASIIDTQRLSGERRRQIVRQLDSLLQREPNFARALASRALVESGLNFYEPSLEWKARGEDDAARALQLDPSLVEARLARHQLLHSSTGGWRVAEGLVELRRAVQDAPGSDIVRFYLARAYRHLGWFDAAQEQLRVVEQINPSAQETTRLRAIFSGDLNHCHEAISAFRATRPTPGDNYPVWQQLAATRLKCGETPPVRNELEEHYRNDDRDGPDYPLTVALLALARLRDGVADVSELEREALATDQRMGHFHHISLVEAEIHAQKGDTRRAVAFLRQTADTGMPSVTTFENDPLLAGIRTSAEYRELIAELQKRLASLHR